MEVTAAVLVIFMTNTSLSWSEEYLHKASNWDLFLIFFNYLDIPISLVAM